MSDMFTLLLTNPKLILIDLSFIFVGEKHTEMIRLTAEVGAKLTTNLAVHIGEEKGM